MTHVTRGYYPVEDPSEINLAMTTPRKSIFYYPRLSKHFPGKDRHLSHTRHISCSVHLCPARARVNNGKASCNNPITARLGSLTVISNSFLYLLGLSHLFNILLTLD